MGEERITPLSMLKPIQGYNPQLPQGSDDFNATTLHPCWSWNHMPREGSYSLTEHPGWLRLKAHQAVGKQKGFFGASGTLHQRTMPSDSTIITIRLDASNLNNDDHAGLAIFNGGKSYACIDIHELNYREAYLRVFINKDGLATFSYSIDNQAYTPYGAPYQLTSGNFRGAMVGIFCYNDYADGGFADFDYFDYYVQNR